MPDTAPRPVRVYRNRHNEVRFSLGIDVSADQFYSQIREGRDKGSELIADWIVSFVTDGSDGELLLTMTSTIAGAITQNSGYMDLKWVSGGLAYPFFETPLRVVISGQVTE